MEGKYYHHYSHLTGQETEVWATWQRTYNKLVSRELSFGKSHPICEPQSPTQTTGREDAVRPRNPKVCVPTQPVPGCLILGESFNSPSSATCSTKREQHSQGICENEIGHNEGSTTWLLVIIVIIPILRIVQSSFLRTQQSGQTSPNTCFAP